MGNVDDPDEFILNLYMILQLFVNFIIKNILPSLYYVIDNNIVEKIFNFIMIISSIKKNLKLKYILLFNIFKLYILNVMFF